MNKQIYKLHYFVIYNKHLPPFQKLIYLEGVRPQNQHNLPIVQETWVHSQVDSYQRLKNVTLCLLA